MATISAASVFGFIFGGGNGEEDVTMGSMWWLIYAGVSCFLVLFAGIMSGLTLGLMSIGLVDLEVLQQGGTPTEKKQAGGFEIERNIFCLSIESPLDRIYFIILGFFLRDDSLV